MNYRTNGWKRAVPLYAAALALCVVMGVSSTAQASGGPMGRVVGLGLSLGNPTSFTGKYYLNDKNALDFHVGAFHAYGSSFWSDSIFLGGDYLYDVWHFFDNATLTVPFYAGPGVGLIFDLYDDVCTRGQKLSTCDNFNFAFGPRMPIGTGVQFKKAPFEVFIELTPTLMFISYNSAHNDGLGLRLDIPNFALVGRFYF